MAYIELNRENLHHNLDQITQRVPLDKLSVVLKDNAYGHGLLEMAQMCSAYGVKKAVVRDIDEATLVSSYFDLVLVLAQVPKSAVEPNIHITINALVDIENIPVKTSVHLKVDTGMHRHGIAIEELDEALEIILKKGLQLAGVMSHARSSDELSSETYWQLRTFRNIREIVLSFCKINECAVPLFHFANSSTITRFEDEVLFDMVRIGIAMYGYSELDAVFKSWILKPVLTLWAEKICTQKVNSQMRLGYGGAGKTLDALEVTSYDIGYADGIFRISNQNNFVIESEKFIVGKVSMDSILITGNSDKVALIEDASQFATLFETISYEILVKLSPKLNRKIS
jgi:alanine racemase